MSAPPSTRALIDDLVRSTGAADPFAAIRLKAREAVEKYRGAFSDVTMPLNIEALASLLGIGQSDLAPAHSKDAELVPESDGHVVIRVNPDRPETRRRFSFGHEITHTFFPNFETKTWCRTDARHRRRDNPDDLLEMLCDVGAAELILPTPWFADDAADVSTGAHLVVLARTYVASREATIRRFAEIHSGSVAAVYLSWKLKPVQERTIGNLDQYDLFGADPAEVAHQAKKLRVDYSVPSSRFAQAGHYLPNDKSVEQSGPVYEAASTGQPCEGECWLDFGTTVGRFRVFAVPLWTDDEDLGPSGENAVGAIIEPLELKASKGKAVNSDPRWFD